MKKKTRNIMLIGLGLVGMYTSLRIIANKWIEDKNIDNDNPYISDSTDNSGKNEISKKLYLDKIKPVLDRIVSFWGLVFLLPLFVVISIAIVVDDPGPIFFSQKRIGKNKRYIVIHKFRSMKVSTPANIPTHELHDPEKYITRVGRVLRRTSLDEIPQIWDIFRGRMSVVGPRPALWNQEDLIAERDRYDANSVLPGLTGLAQIKGRDELLIPAKAKMDGQYVEMLKQGGWKAFIFDIKIVCATVKSVIRHEGVVEGGTGRMGGVRADEVGFEEYGFQKIFTIDKKAKKRILITGAGSYIGDSFKSYCDNHYSNIECAVIDMRDERWREKNFCGFDAVFHVAGIAHVDEGKMSKEEKARYYAVNTDLVIETAKKAKKEGIKQFIFMSSMIIYGDSAPLGKKKIIDEHTIPQPTSIYGDSKWKADKGVRKLQADDFKVAVLRSPMVYGKGSKGNYLKLAAVARKIPFFPDVNNSRSMLYIENLCEFVALLSLSGKGGIYFPQNNEYTRTVEMVQEIGMVANKNIRRIKILNPTIFIAGKIPGKISNIVNKVFGNNLYTKKLSHYKGINYCKVSLKESIRRTEGADTVSNFNCFAQETKQREEDTQKGENRKCATDSKQIHILVISQYFYPETFRINDIATEWVNRGYKVTVLTGIPNYPTGKFFKGYGYRQRRRESWNGVEVIRIPLIPRGNNNLGIFVNYVSFVVSGWAWKMMNDIQADLVFTCEVSPMTQALIGCWYADKYHIPHFLYVQDLWPENIQAAMNIRNKLVIGTINKMVDWIYRHADQIFVTSPSFVSAITNRKVQVDTNKVQYWPQYAESFYKPVEREQVRMEIKETSPIYLIPDDDSFKIVYTGNIGTVQGLDILPKVAKKFKKSLDSHGKKEKDIRFVIVGDGRYQEQFKADIVKRGVGEMFIMIPRQKAELIPSILSCCDVAFLSFSDMPLWEKTIPAKLQSYMACGMPIIASAKGETKRIITEAECGLCIDMGDIEGVVNGIKYMIKQDLKTMGINSKIYAKRYFNKEVLMDDMDDNITYALNHSAVSTV